MNFCSFDSFASSALHHRHAMKLSKIMLGRRAHMTALGVPLLLGFVVGISAPTRAEDLPNAPEPQPQSPSAAGSSLQAVTVRDLPFNFTKDQAAIWTSPVRLREGDLKWLIPLGLATAVAITADHQAMSSGVSHDPDFNHKNVLASDVMTGMLIAAPVGLFGKGELEKDADAQESGILGAEALLDGVVVEQGMKLIFWRERPGVDDAKGKFFQTSVGADSSFPSSHSVLSWASAGVLGAEYPSGWQPVAIYTLATGVSLTRVLGQEHFPSDVIVGSAVGYLVGRYVFHKHHRPSPDDSPMN
jgi:PAP2 superfamily